MIEFEPLINTVKEIDRVFSKLNLTDSEKKKGHDLIAGMFSLIADYSAEKILLPSGICQLAVSLIKTSLDIPKIHKTDQNYVFEKIKEISHWSENYLEILNQPQIDAYQNNLDEPFSIASPEIWGSWDFQGVDDTPEFQSIHSENPVIFGEEPANESFFYYDVTGEKARLQGCEKDTELSLAFSIDRLSENSVKAIGKKLSGLDYVDVSIIAAGYRRHYEDKWMQTLWLDKKDEFQKSNSIRFRFIAENKADPDAGFWVNIDYKGRPIYHYKILVPVLEEFPKEGFNDPGKAETALEVDLDKLSLFKGYKQSDLTINIRKNSNLINLCVKKNNPDSTGDKELLNETIHDNDLDNRFCKSKGLDVNALIQIVSSARKKVNEVTNIASFGLWNPEKRADERIRAKFSSSLKDIALEGWRLRKSLMENVSMEALFTEVEELPEGARISIQTNTLGLPWDIIYTEDPDEKECVDPDKFWGIRYRIECFRTNKNTKTGSASSNNQGSLTCLIDPAIGNNHMVALQKKLTTVNIVSNSGNQCDQNKMLLKMPGGEQCVYIFCHGEADRALEFEGRLSLGQGCDLSAIDLANTKPYQNNPLVIINACNGAAISPFSESSFCEEFVQKNALGVVASMFTVPTANAEKIGESLLTSYIVNRQTIGDALAAIRRQWINADNPVPLFYQLQCHMDARI